jgi:hypothetical protein
MAASDDTSYSLVDTDCSPIDVGVALNGAGWRVVQLFHRYIHWQISPVATGGCDTTSHTPTTPRATPATTGNGQSNKFKGAQA